MINWKEYVVDLMSIPNQYSVVFSVIHAFQDFTYQLNIFFCKVEGPKTSP